MNEDELREILRMLEEAGMRPSLCDTPVAVSSCTAVCGLPTEPGPDVIKEYFLLPKSLVGLNPTVFVQAEGDSMRDAGIEDGDQLLLRLGAPANDGDIVAACIDNACTIKCLYTDPKGTTWLVPRNKEYKPIMLTETMDVRILGVVDGIKKASPRTSLRTLDQAVKAYRPTEPAAPETPAPGDATYWQIFRTDKYPLRDCEAQLYDALIQSPDKATAARKLLTQDTLGYLSLRGFTDVQKAELLNRYIGEQLHPKYPDREFPVFSRDDFQYARNRRNPGKGR